MRTKLTTGPDIVTFGCRLNRFESEQIRALAAEAGADGATIFNTCAVTCEAVKQARQTIRRTRRENAGSRIIVTGCAAQVDGSSFADMPEVDLVLGNEEKLKSSSYRHRSRQAKSLIGDIMQARTIRPDILSGFAGRTRALVQVQNGCDHRCTFCIIPYGRGNSRSVPPKLVVEQIQTLVQNGYTEAILTGVDLTSYGNDLGSNFKLGQLVRMILAEVPELQRLRLSSIDLIEADEDLMIALAEEERFMPHLHLSLQAGDNLILKRMRRRHSREDAIAFCAEARRLRPDVAFGADLIAGFPTETEEMFQNSIQLLDECGISLLHVFPFSPRPGTPAAKMPQVDGGVRKERAARLRQAGEARQGAWLNAQLGVSARVLMETERSGRTPQHARVVVDEPAQVGAIIDVMITGRSGDHLRGQLVA